MAVAGCAPCCCAVALRSGRLSLAASQSVVGSRRCLDAVPPVAALPASPRLFAWHPASLETPPPAAPPLAGSTQCSITHGVTHEAHQHTGPQPHTHTQPTAATHSHKRAPYLIGRRLGHGSLGFRHGLGNLSLQDLTESHAHRQRSAQRGTATAAASPGMTAITPAREC